MVQTRTERATRLPPGQRLLANFPRFGLLLDRPAPPVPDHPRIAIRGAVREPIDLPLTELRALPRREVTADFHCVAGWSVTGLRWEGVPFRAFYATVIEPALAPGATVTHLRLGGLDGYRAGLTIEDALGEDVLIAETLDEQPLDSDHGAPARFVSPNQYGFLSVKHLCRIEVHTSEPKDDYDVHPISRAFLFLYRRHPRARVWAEERVRVVPGWAVRPIGRLVTKGIVKAGARGSRRSEPPSTGAEQ